MIKENKYLEALNLHKGNDKYRFWMNTPFYVNNLAIATDGHTMIKMSKDFVQGLNICERDNPSDILNVIPDVKNENLKLDLEDIIKAISKIKKKDGYDVIGEDCKCGECGGSGEVEWEYESWTKDMDCPKCDGEGYESLEIKKPNGKKIIDESFFIDIKESRFSIKIINRLLETAKILDEKEIVLVCHLKHNAPSIFKIGEVEVLCMPVNKFNNDDKVILTIQKHKL